MARFQNHKFLITGGTSGIGLAAAKRLVTEGATVLVTGTDPERVSAADALDGITGIANDAGDPASIQPLVDAVKNFGPLDGAFLNAGFGRFHPLADVTAEEFDVHYAVNVRGPLLQAKALAPLLKDGGSIVCNTSVAGQMGLSNASIYSSTKGALRTIVRVLANELAGRNIRVNAVSPGPISTAFFDRTGLPQEAIDDFSTFLKSRVPLGRFGRSEEVAAVALFLLSADASYVTGSEYMVDGGMTEV